MIRGSADQAADGARTCSALPEVYLPAGAARTRHPLIGKPRMFHKLDALFPVRYAVMELCLLGLLVALVSLASGGSGWMVLLVCALLLGLGIHDVRQTQSSILRNYPVIGHLRFLLEFIRPEMRQYFIESDSEAVPFSRAQRSLVYQRAKGEMDNRSRSKV